MAMEEIEVKPKNTHGGRREGAGRKKGTRVIPVFFTISEEAFDVLSGIANRSKWLDELLKKMRMWFFA